MWTTGPSVLSTKRRSRLSSPLSTKRRRESLWCVACIDYAYVLTRRTCYRQQTKRLAAERDKAVAGERIANQKFTDVVQLMKAEESKWKSSIERQSVRCISEYHIASVDCVCARQSNSDLARAVARANAAEAKLDALSASLREELEHSQKMAKQIVDLNDKLTDAQARSGKSGTSDVCACGVCVCVCVCVCV
jgi:hypothetical protein